MNIDPTPHHRIVDHGLAQEPCKVQVAGLSVYYGSRRALDGVNLSIRPRAVTAVVGPSGCGKSTFLTCLNRLCDLTAHCRVEGSVRLDGQEILAKDCEVLALRRRVGMVFQKPNPFPLTIRRNISLPLREHGVGRRETAAKIESVLKEVELWEEVKDRLDESALRLSGGQQQRLCIARALALEPELILFDEPCSALDPLASGAVEEHIARLREKVTVVIVTHNLAQARRIADDLAVFWLENDAGVLLESGPAEKVFTSPGHPTTAAYLQGMRG